MARMTTSRPVALVTGASSGIGDAAAAALAKAGFDVIGTSRNTADSVPGTGVTFLDLDVTSDESVAARADRCARQQCRCRRRGCRRGELH